jgi:hypothetical protein
MAILEALRVSLAFVAEFLSLLETVLDLLFG